MTQLASVCYDIMKDSSSQAFAGCVGAVNFFLLMKWFMLCKSLISKSVHV